MNPAFCARASGLSYTEQSKFQSFIFGDDDLSTTGPSDPKGLLKGEWHKSHLCDECGINTIEYREVYSRQEVEALIAEQEEN